ncbi:MAG: hypothetical protein ACYCXP_04210 [Leptospirillum sp.]
MNRLMKRFHIQIHLGWIIISILLLTGCTPLISQFDVTAYRDATSLKVDSLVIMSEATTSYTLHSDKVEQFNVKLNKAYEYVKGIPHNSITTQMWFRLIDPKGFLLGGFLQKWKSDGVLKPAFVKDMEKQVSETFDAIICLEANKKGLTQCH